MLHNQEADSGSRLASRKRPLQTGSGNPALQEIDPATAFFYAPRTLTALGLGVLGLAYWSNVFQVYHETPASQHVQGHSAQNSKAGIWAAIVVFLGYSLVQGPETSMARPHPAFWRLVHGCLVVYLALLTWILFQNLDDARQFMQHLHPALGKPVQYRSYATDCHLWVPGQGWNWMALRETVVDEFVIAHTLGWWGKALVARNWTLLWIGSVMFEMMELTFAHMLPNFNECWWDSWLLDVAVCNVIGITAGMHTVRWLELAYKNYNWQGLSQLQTVPAKARRSLMQLGPYSWDHFNWMLFSSPLRMIQSLAVVALMLNVELNAFFLKYLLWVPPPNPLNSVRLVLWFLAVLPGVREWYQYIEGGSKALSLFPKVGSFAWMAIAINSVETLITIKFSKGQFPSPWPRAVIFAWAVAGGLLVSGLAIWQLLRMTSHARPAVAMAAPSGQQTPSAQESTVQLLQSDTPASEAGSPPSEARMADAMRRRR